MTLFGVTPTGFNAPTEAEELALIEADQRANLSATLDLSENSVLGQVNRIFAQRNVEAWNALKAIYEGGDPKLTRGDAATSLAKITGTERRGASRSHVDVMNTLQKDTALRAGVHFAHVTDRPGSRWTPIENFTAPDDGSFTLRFQAENAGPIDTPVDSIAVIATPVVGWSAVTGSGEVEIGRDTDDDADLLARREQDLQRAGSSTTGAIRSDILALEAAVSAQVFENDTDQTDPITGLPPKSFESVVYAPDATDDQIAQAIWNSRSAGIATVGSSSGTAYDSEGNPHVVRFSRVAQVEVWVTYELVRLGDYVGDETFRETIATRLDAALQAGVSVSEWDVTTAAHALGVKLTGVTFGLAPAPTASDEIVLGTRQIARFDAGRITLT